MARSKTAWKSSEKQWAETLTAYSLTAIRRTRAGNWSQVADDVAVEELPETAHDSKYSESQSWKSNRLLEETMAKYCKNPGDSAVLITKSFKELGQCATVDSEFMAMLLAHWAGVAPKEDLWKIYLGRSKRKFNKMTKGKKDAN